ncbi:hypothetical protein COOONC_11840 [Cooperia oncophora]
MVIQVCGSAAVECSTWTVTLCDGDVAQPRQANDARPEYEVSRATVASPAICDCDPTTSSTSSTCKDGDRWPYRSISTELLQFLVRTLFNNTIFRSLPVVENEDVVPLVQYFDSDSSAKARLSHAASDCIYRARVADTEDTSIVNLCDSDNGLYGLLALPDGVYSVEPIAAGGNSSNIKPG